MSEDEAEAMIKDAQHYITESELEKTRCPYTRKVLIVDDEPMRHRKIQKQYRGQFAVESADDVHSAIRKLKDNDRYDIVSLDWGLDPGHTGFEVCAAIIDLPPYKRPRRVVVHSGHAVHGPEMANVLHQAGILSEWIPA